MKIPEPANIEALLFGFMGLTIYDIIEQVCAETQEERDRLEAENLITAFEHMEKIV